MGKKFKTAINITAVLAIITVAFAAYFFFYFKVKGRPERLFGGEKAEVSNVQLELNEQRKSIEELKRIIEADKAQNLAISQEVESLKSKQKVFVVKDEFSGILISLNTIENKLNKGGNIEKDIIKLKAFSVNIPEISAIVTMFENVNFLSSKTELNTEFEEYVKTVKSSLTKQEGGKVNQVLAVVSEYITILNSKNPHDQLLLTMKDCLSKEDYICAVEVSSKIGVENEKTTKFLKDLQTSSRVKSGIEKIYLFIGEALNKTESVERING